jgi:hypothetical protein
MFTKKWIYLLACLAVLQTATTLAQEFRGTVLGRVTDPSGAVIAGAKVTITNEETNISVGIETNAEGNYVAPYIVPGRYKVAVEASGFRRSLREGIIVQVNDRIALDLALQIGATTETVTVTGESPQLQTASADLGQVVDRAFLDRLPVTGRTVLSFADMAPGVLGGGGGGWPGGVASNDQNKIAMNGGNGTDKGNDITVDGVPALAPRQAGLAVGIPMSDAVLEFKVATTMFDASLGRSNGGAMAITTRSGTNQYHGSGYYFTEKAGLDANSWTNNRVRIARQPINRYAAGGTVGGPVRLPKYDGHNRTFFFFGFEKSINGRSAAALARVPTSGEQQGDFSKTLAPSGVPLALYNPFSTRTNATGGFVARDVFPGARIPASLLNPTGVAAMGKLPSPTENVPAQLGLQNWASTMNFTARLKNFQTRIDHQVGDRHRLFARVAVLDYLASPDVPYFPGAYNVPPNGTSNLNTDSRRHKSAIVDDTITFTPSFIGSLRAGYTRVFTYNFMDGDRQNPADLKLPAAIAAHQIGPAWPIFNISADGAPFIGSRPRLSVNDVWTAMGNFTKLRGNHGLRFGVDYRAVRWNENNPGEQANGQFVFNNTLTRQDPTKSSTGTTSGSAMASLLLGLPATTGNSRIGYTSALTLQSHYAAFFLQDDWKVSGKLVLNLGLRYELETPSTERFDRLIYAFDGSADLGLKATGLGPLRGGVQFVNDGGIGRRQGRLDTNNFGPRVGFAWTPAPSFVVRGGYGLFFSSGINNLSSGTPSTDAAFGATTPYVGSSDSDTTPIPGVGLANPFPSGYVQPTGKTLGLATDLGSNVSFLNPNRALPYVQQFQLSLQKEFRGQTLGEIAYVRMHSLRLYEDYNLNELPDSALSLTNNVPNPFRGLLPATSTLGQGSTVRANRLTVTFPAFNTVTMQRNPTGRNNYHGLQARVQKRMSHGLQVMANYTFSKALLYYQYSAVNARPTWRAVSSIDTPHMFRAFAVYDLPFGRGRSWGRNWSRGLDSVAGGWSLTWATRYNSGQPLSLSDTNGQPIPIADPRTSGSTKDRLGDRIDSATRLPVNPFLRPSAFAHLPDFTISREPLLYSWLRAPGQLKNSVTLAKTLSIAERWKLELRVDIDSPFNSPQFEAPNTNLATPSAFGTITSAGGARVVVFGAKVRF